MTMAPSLPPGLQALLSGGNAAPPGQPPPQQAPSAPESPEVARQELQILQQMIDLGNHYQAIQPDAEQRATMAKVLVTLHQYMAQEQKDAQTALGGGPATRVLRNLSR